MSTIIRASTALLSSGFYGTSISSYEVAGLFNRWETMKAWDVPTFVGGTVGVSSTPFAINPANQSLVIPPSFDAGRVSFWLATPTGHKFKANADFVACVRPDVAVECLAVGWQVFTPPANYPLYIPQS